MTRSLYVGTVATLPDRQVPTRVAETVLIDENCHDLPPIFPEFHLPNVPEPPQPPPPLSACVTICLLAN